MHTLQLAVNLTGWRIFISRKKAKAFLPVAKRALERDDYTCQYCAFQAQDYQEVVNLDGNYLNNKFSNLVTACCFCVQCLFLQAVGFDEMGGGQLIYLPEMSQTDLNSFCHVLFCALGNTTDYNESAQSIYRSLKFRSQIIENKFGGGTSQPAIMGQLFIEYQERHPTQNIHYLFNDLRLLPSHANFQAQLKAWAGAAVKELESESEAV